MLLKCLMDEQKITCLGFVLRTGLKKILREKNPGLIMILYFFGITNVHGIFPSNGVYRFVQLGHS